MNPFRWTVCLFALAWAGCATLPPSAPQIDRLPEGAAGRIAPPRLKPVSLDEVVEMARTGAPSNVIIQTLRDTRANYLLTAQEGQSLARRGVPPEVIAYLRGQEEVTPAWSRSHDDPYYGPDYGYPYYAPYYAPYGWGHPYGPWYPGTGVYFGFGRRW